MKVYLVGGAVRDQLLGLPVKEKDWVVVNATIEEMLALNYKQVGKDFPVFLHPQTKEEYALARLEKKVSKGYTGFEFVSDPQVTLEEDLKRRDLTINAIAMSNDGKLIDPFAGQADIQAKKLRHISSAFEEDPVRILRLARFAARFAALGFTVAEETMELCQRMVESGEVDALVAERVWKECSRALEELQFDQFFKVLKDCHAAAKLFPEIDFTAEKFVLLKRAALTTNDPVIRFAVTLFNIDKASHLMKRLRVPSVFAALAQLVNQYYSVITQNMTPTTLLNCFERADAFRREERFKQFIVACEIISQQDLNFVLKILKKLKTLDLSSLPLQNLSGLEIKTAISAARLKIIQSL